MTTKEIVLQVIDAFDNNDVDKILSLFADDVIWTMKGSSITVSNGKDEVGKFLGAMEDIKIVSSTRDHIIVDVIKPPLMALYNAKAKAAKK
ncbi:nuclear transport factor 2 family protein [Mucilaginibacter sp. NFX135]|uniref:nuclear transport factor 2 family protein n=1 Tax=Mucilaginibacter sp. NFX135 TaxID=3402687 RepID=UPI003AFB452F